MTSKPADVFRLLIFLAFVQAALWSSSPLAAQTKKGSSAKSIVKVPVVGCKSEGQVGPLDAPKPSVAKLPLEPAMAERLAVYKAKNGPAVLGPSGWSCFGYYGSGSAHLNLTAATVDPKAGEADFMIQAWLIHGETSGRFTVADIIAHVFPAHRSFVNHVASERMMDEPTFPSGPFPPDQLTYRSDRIVEFETPKEAKGLGTYFLTPNGYSVRGVTVLTAEPNIRHLAVRLPPDMNDIASVIIEQFEAGLPE